MKIIFLIRSLEFGGAERQLIALAKQLQNRQHEIQVAVFYSGGPLEQDLAAANIPIVDLHKTGRWDIFAFMWRLFRHIKKEKPQIIHGYLHMPNLLCTLLKPFCAKMKVVWGIRDSNIDLSKYDWLAKIDFKLSCWLARFADLIIANSKVGKAHHVAHGFPAEKIKIIPNGIDTAIFYPKYGEKKQLRESWGLTEQDILVGLIARFDPMKDHRTFLQAAAIAGKKQSQLSFLCMGNGDENYIKQLQQLAQDLGLNERIIWEKARIEIENVYNCIDLLISCSAYGEGFSNVIGEAMACGKPCVVTDVGDSAWLVNNCGKVVPAGNVNALANGIIELATLDHDSRTKLGQAARQRIVKNFNLEQLGQKTEHLLQKLTPFSTSYSYTDDSNERGE